VHSQVLRACSGTLFLAVLAGCGSAQKIKVDVDPVGAEVYLQRRGDIEIRGTVQGVPGTVRARAFEEGFRLLGNAPVEYQFDLTEREVGVEIPGGNANVERRYREGTVRVERPGYETVVRVVAFTGGTAHLKIDLQPEGSN
jgi:hypothetical protein